MKNINETLRSAEAQQDLPLNPLSPPSQEDLLRIRKYLSIQGIYRWMLDDLSQRIGGTTDKQIAKALGMDTGYFSRIMQGSASFSCEKELQLMRLCGRGDPVYWRLYQMGMDPTTLRCLETESEKTIRELKEENQRLREEQAVLSRALRGDQIK